MTRDNVPLINGNIKQPDQQIQRRWLTPPAGKRVNRDKDMENLIRIEGGRIEDAISRTKRRFRKFDKSVLSVSHVRYM